MVGGLCNMQKLISNPIVVDGRRDWISQLTGRVGLDLNLIFPFSFDPFFMYVKLH